MSLTLPFRVIDLLGRAASRRKNDAEDAPIPPVEARRAQRPPSWALRPTPSDVAIRDTSAESVPVRVYTPSSPSGVGLLYIHGGGFMVGGLDACHHICADLAHLSGATVVSVDYRLAPEDPYPAGLDDVREALGWFREQAAALGVDGDRIVVGGDSAGGNLAAALCLTPWAEPLAGQIIVYPMLDLTCSRDSWLTEGTPYMNREGVLDKIHLYYGASDVRDPLVSPLFAASFAGLPPALVITAQHDPLRDDGADYAAQLRQAGIPVRYLEFPRMMHAFLSWPRLTRQYGQALDVMSDFLRRTQPASVSTTAARDEVSEA